MYFGGCILCACYGMVGGQCVTVPSLSLSGVAILDSLKCSKLGKNFFLACFCNDFMLPSRKAANVLLCCMDGFVS